MEKLSNISKLKKWMSNAIEKVKGCSGTILAVVTIVGVIITILFSYFYVTEKQIENTDLKNRVGELENKVQNLQSELGWLRAAYQNLLVVLINDKNKNLSMNDIEPFLPREEAKTIERKASILALSLPANVDVYFYPSGWVGDGEYERRYLTFARSEDFIKINYVPGPKEWAGIYWQYPDSNWGQKPGFNLTGAKKLTFWAKGETGNEIVEFKTGGIRGQKYEDSFVKSIGRIKLSQSWKQYDIDITDQDLSSVIGAFVWVASKDTNPKGLTFYLKDIYFEK